MPTITIQIPEETLEAIKRQAEAEGIDLLKPWQRLRDQHGNMEPAYRTSKFVPFGLTHGHNSEQ